MKRIFFILFLIGSMALPALSQTGLHIAQLFDGPFKRRTGATEVYMKGRSVKNYGLSIFRSLSVSYSPDDLRRMETLVRLDARQAVSKEESYKARRSTTDSTSCPSTRASTATSFTSTPARSNSRPH